MLDHPRGGRLLLQNPGKSMANHPPSPSEGAPRDPQTVRADLQGEHPHGHDHPHGHAHPHPHAHHGHATGGPVEFILNGAPQHVVIEPHETLLFTLRERCGVTSLKDGCHPQGQCGACLAIVHGHARVTCNLPTEMVRGHEVTTLEGLPERERALLAQAFSSSGAVQCGFCLPAIALHASAFLDKHPDATREVIAKGLDQHLCRCTGYTSILDGVELMARARRGEPIPPPLAEGGVGASIRRYDVASSVLGVRPYVADLRRPEMLHGALVFTKHARAKVVHIDTAGARAIEGVRAVLTAADVPGERWYGLILSDWPGLVAEGEEVRCAGDVLAVIAADTEAIAREAAALVEVTYEVRSPLVDPEEALRPGAARVNPCHDNLLSRTELHRGDARAALGASAHVVHQTFHTQRIEHLFLEPECALCEPLPDGRLKLYTQGQGVFDDRRQVAAYLKIDEEDLIVELMPTGGAFGGKEDLSVQAHAALLARITGRPVKVALRRDESIRMHPKRHPMKLEYTVGCDEQGHLTAIVARILGDSGAYASVGAKVLERAAGHAAGPYRVPAVEIEALAVYTNNPPSGAMRGFGVNQTSFAMEGCLDALAAKVGIDGWEIRRRNVIAWGDALVTGQIMDKATGIVETLDAVKGAYYQAKAEGRAVGIACGIKNSGLGNGAEEWGKTRLVVEPDRTVSIYGCFTEMGQGLFTIQTQIAAEATRLPSSVFRPRVDSTYPLGAGQTTGSRATLLGGRAVEHAARRLRADLDEGNTLGDLVGRVYPGEIVVKDTCAPGEGEVSPKVHTSFGFATQVCVLDAQGKLARIIAAHDVGRAINPALCKGQIEGAVAMGLGYALTEELLCEDGIPVHTTLREIGALRAHDMPPVDVILVEVPEPEGPYGAKGVGEIGLVPTAGAVAGALEAFDGIRRTRLPMRDSPAARATSAGHIHLHRGRPHP
ncbi:MAG: selenium-dependent xanthine dehydrogenase [Byssovorax sp.]